jgi:prepilin-type N-terminal cleavage/methylation domain-containing protein
VKINKKGFTLIELLVVISIIGILAGILVLVINPTQQQNKARNATIKSTMLKIAYGINAARASNGSIPSNTIFPNEISAIATSPAVVTTGTALNYRFAIDGVNLPDSCATGLPSTTGTAACQFTALSADLSGSEYRVYAEVYSVNPSDLNRVYVYSSTYGFWDCPSTMIATITGTSDFTAATSFASCTALD